MIDVEVLITVNGDNLDTFLKISTYLDRSKDKHRELLPIFKSSPNSASEWELSLGWGESEGQINLSMKLNGKNCFEDCHLQTDRSFPNTLRLVMFFDAALRNPKTAYEHGELSLMGQIMLFCMELFWKSKNVENCSYNFKRNGIPGKVISIHRELVVDLSNGEKIKSFNKKRPRECLQDLYLAMGFISADHFNFFYNF